MKTINRERTKYKERLMEGKYMEIKKRERKLK